MLLGTAQGALEAFNNARSLAITIQDVELKKALKKVGSKGPVIVVSHGKHRTETEEAKISGSSLTWNQAIDLPKTRGNDLALELWDGDKKPKKVAEVVTSLDQLATLALTGKNELTLLTSDTAFYGNLSFEVAAKPLGPGETEWKGFDRDVKLKIVRIELPTTKNKPTPKTFWVTMSFEKDKFTTQEKPDSTEEAVFNQEFNLRPISFEEDVTFTIMEGDKNKGKVVGTAVGSLEFLHERIHRGKSFLNIVQNKFDIGTIHFEIEGEHPVQFLVEEEQLLDRNDYRVQLREVMLAKKVKPSGEALLHVTAVQGKYKAKTKEWKESDKSHAWGDQFEFHYSDGQKIVFELWDSSDKKPKIITALETNFTDMKKNIYRGNSKLGLSLADGTSLGYLFFEWINTPPEDGQAGSKADIQKPKTENNIDQPQQQSQSLLQQAQSNQHLEENKDPLNTSNVQNRSQTKENASLQSTSAIKKTTMPSNTDNQGGERPKRTGKLQLKPFMERPAIELPYSDGSLTEILLEGLKTVYSKKPKNPVRALGEFLKTKEDAYVPNKKSIFG